MANVINHVIEQSFFLSTSLYFDVTGSLTPTGVRNCISGSKWYRTSLVPYNGDGSSDILPLSLWSTFKSLFNGNEWAFARTTNGNVIVHYTTASYDCGPQVDFINTELMHLLGFNASATPGSYQFNQYYPSITGSYQPTHGLYWFAALNDTNFERLEKQVAVTQQPNGVVYGWANSVTSWERTFDIAYLPVNLATLADNATPCHDVELRFAVNPNGYISTATTQDVVPPWNLGYFMDTVMGNRCGYVIGAAQTLFAGSAPEWYEGYVTAETLKQKNIVNSVAGYKQLKTWKGFKITLTNAYQNLG